MYRIYRCILFLWIQLRRSNERSSYHISLCHIWNNNRNRLVLNTTSMVTPLISMKQFNTWVLDTTIYILDFLYRGRNFQRFWVLEVIARAPYFAFISVLHFRESLGLRGEDHIYLMKEHFYQALNETEHLEEMERRGGDTH